MCVQENLPEPGSWGGDSSSSDVKKETVDPEAQPWFKHPERLADRWARRAERLFNAIDTDSDGKVVTTELLTWVKDQTNRVSAMMLIPTLQEEDFGDPALVEWKMNEFFCTTATKEQLLNLKEVVSISAPTFVKLYTIALARLYSSHAPEPEPQ